MPRPRARLIVGGAPFADDIPGLCLVTRGHGRRQPYWRASKEAVRLGYRPKNIELRFDLIFTPLERRRGYAVTGTPGEFDRLVAACRAYDAEMARWLDTPNRAPKIIFNGTYASLIDVYQRHPLSPYRTLKPNTQQCYDEWCAVLREIAGDRRIDRTIGPDLRQWFAAVRKPDGWEAAPRDRLAYGAVRQMPRILVNFGMELGLAPCYRLSKILAVTKLSIPRDEKTGRRRRKKRVAMTFAQAEAIVNAGIAKGTPQHRSVALGLAAQFEFALAQIDVIGWWEERTNLEKIEPGEITDGKWIWRPGLRYEDLASGILEIERSKTGVPGVFDVGMAPLFERALAAVPAEQRTGPLVVDSRGKPMQRRYYVDLYRELADAAGVPAAIKNMHARHGAASEADEAGVGEDDISRGLTLNTKAVLRAHYLKGGVLSKSRRIAKARVESRDRKDGAA